MGDDMTHEQVHSIKPFHERIMLAMMNSKFNNMGPLKRTEPHPDFGNMPQGVKLEDLIWDYNELFERSTMYQPMLPGFEDTLPKYK